MIQRQFLSFEGKPALLKNVHPLGPNLESKGMSNIQKIGHFVKDERQLKFHYILP